MSYVSEQVLQQTHVFLLYIFTGITGIILTVIVIVMFVFAVPYARRNLFKAFWFTHGFYILLYIFLILHGSGRLVQAPLTQNFLYGPLVVFVFDKLISISRMKLELSVKKSDLLPSGIYERTSYFTFHASHFIDNMFEV